MTFRVKNQLVNLVTEAARVVMNIEQRLRNGIFDPEADKRDFAAVSARRSPLWTSTQKIHVKNEKEQTE
ncbi:MAG: hypothetical protein ACREBD_38010 [Blastocatellia bacterium]